MLSPEALGILGNNAGRSGIMIFVALTIGALLSLFTIAMIHDPAITKRDSSLTCLAAVAGLLPAMTLTLASRLGLALFLPTGMLVTAGFTFNETFVYWFPNFAFSFLLLAIVLTLHLAGERVALLAQPFFVGLTMSCLVLLCLAGLIGSPEETWSTEIQTGNPLSLSLHVVFTALLLFLGYDQPGSALFSGSRVQYIVPLMAGFILLALWGFVSLKHVPRAKLAASTIPYSISAREIFGQPGRVIIGVAVISGTCGLVNGLFLLAERSLRHMADYISPLPPFRAAYNGRILPVIFSVCIGIFMAAGLAGSDKLKIFIYGALLLWLVQVGTHCFAAASRLHKQQKSCRYRYLLVAVFPLAVLWLACRGEHATALVVFFFLALAVSAACSAGWVWYEGKRPNKTIQDSQGDLP